MNTKQMLYTAAIALVVVIVAPMLGVTEWFNKK